MAKGGIPEKQGGAQHAAGGRWTDQQRQHAVAIALSYALRASTNIVSGHYTVAYNISVVQMMGVFVMGFASWLVLGEELSCELCIAATLSVVGSIMVVTGQHHASLGGGDDVHNSANDAIGIALQSCVQNCLLLFAVSPAYYQSLVVRTGS